MKTVSVLVLITAVVVITTLTGPISAVGSYDNPTISPSPNDDDQDQGSDFIRTSCVTTLYPDLCYNSLSRYSVAVNQSPAQLARVAISVSLSHAQRAAKHFADLTRHRQLTSDDSAASAALRDCFSEFSDAAEEIRGSLRQIRHLTRRREAGSGESFRFQMSNVQTWMSAALTDQETCTDGFDGVANDSPIKSDVFSRATEVKHHTSNALALVNSYAQNSLP